MNQVQQSINEFGSCEISHGTMRLQDMLPVLLETLKTVNPHGYEQCVMPACGFPLIPSHALEDENDNWWYENASCVTIDCHDLLTLWGFIDNENSGRNSIYRNKCSKDAWVIIDWHGYGNFFPTGRRRNEESFESSEELEKNIDITFCA